MFLAGLISGDGMVDKTALILTSTVGQNFYIWNLITAGFLETNFLKLLLSLLWVATAGCKVEAMLGIESYAIFVNVVNFACGVVTSIGLFSLYVLTRFEIYLQKIEEKYKKSLIFSSQNPPKIDKKYLQNRSPKKIVI